MPATPDPTPTPTPSPSPSPSPTPTPTPSLGRPELCQRVYLTSVSRLQAAKQAGAAQEEAGKENAGAEGAELVPCEAGFQECDAFFPDLAAAHYRLVKSSGPKRQPAKGDKVRVRVSVRVS